MTDAAALDFRILGPLEVVGDGGPLGLGGSKQRATLAILLLNANRVVSIEQIADDLYAGAPPVTAVTQVQRQVSELRKALGAPDAIVTRAPGYAILLEADAFDLGRFEHAADAGAAALARGDAADALAHFRRALGEWRGDPLADLAYESFAQPARRRLAELRLTAVEQRIAAELALGLRTGLIAELEELVQEHPLRERLCAQLMTALYRDGRQAEALAVYRSARTRLVDELGIEPTPALREIEARILRQDADLETPDVEATSSVLVLAATAEAADRLLSVAAPLARRDRELLVAGLVADPQLLAPTAAALNGLRERTDAAIRTASFTSSDAVGDALRLAATYDVELLLVEAPSSLADSIPDELARLLLGSPADVAIASGGLRASGDGIFVAFGGSDHDWAALETGAQLAASLAAPLRLVGTAAASDRRDASRLLADAALAVQRLLGIASEPVLADSLAAGMAGATLAVVGLPTRWEHAGLGASRAALLAPDGPPVLLVHRGLRPGAIAPRAARTHFTWSLA